jgi:tetratricopeptide (TPR) repeat protein
MTDEAARLREHDQSGDDGEINAEVRAREFLRKSIGPRRHVHSKLAWSGQRGRSKLALMRIHACMVWLLAGLASAKLPAAEPPAVNAAIPAAVQALGKPASRVFPGGIRMAVSAASEEVQGHVNQGLNHLHGGWEFEASRHFAAAMRGDPDCLLAHWGMAMCLLNPTPENKDARVAAIDRMLVLLERGMGTELERGYAYGLIKYLEEGPAGAANAFRKVAARFPNDLQAAVLAALFGRGGHDESGAATPDQAQAEGELLALIAKQPDSSLPLNALLFIRAEAPDLTASLELARRLSLMVPDYPPYIHLLGHYEWRCGNHGRAASAFGRAALFYQQWMKEQQVGLADSPEWVKSECYRVVALVSKGDFDTAYAAARQVAATPFISERPASPGNRFLLWEAKTLPARVLLHRGLRGNANEAAFSLPKPVEVKPFHDSSMAYWWIDGLRFVLESRRLIDQGDLDAARETVNALTLHGEQMAKAQTAAAAGGERSDWLRGFRAMEVLASDLRGRLAMAGPAGMRGVAFNWFRSAADRQQAAPLLMPPAILTPMSARLGEYFVISKQPEQAIEAYQQALASRPNDMSSLLGLKRAMQSTGMTAEAAAVEEKIRALKDQ